MTTRLKIACLQEPESCLFGEVHSSGPGFGLLPTLRKLKIRFDYTEFQSHCLYATYISNIGDFGGLSMIARFLSANFTIAVLPSLLKSLCEPTVEDLEIEPSESDSFGEVSFLKSPQNQFESISNSK